jgi:hypothetical protein
METKKIGELVRGPVAREGFVWRLTGWGHSRLYDSEKKRNPKYESKKNPNTKVMFGSLHKLSHFD